LFVLQLLGEREASLRPFLPRGTLIRRDKFLGIVEKMRILSIFKLPANFVGEDELDDVPLLEVDAFDDVLVVSFMEDPPEENCVIDVLLKSSAPIIIGRLAGKVRYPN
jgi:hypothetical protein